MRKLAFLLSFILPLQAHSQIITTIAGTGTSGFSGDGGSATSATINYAGDIVTDGSGNVYFSDYNNNRVRKINSSGIISTIAGTGTAGYNGDGIAATTAKLNTPYGLALDDTGNLYIADYANQRIRKVNTSGIISTIAGTGTGAYSGDGGLAIAADIWVPNYVCTDHFGNIFISDNQNKRIRKVNNLGIISTYAGTGSGGYNGDGIPATAAQVNSTAGIKTDNTGNLYIADLSNNRIRKVTTSGYISTIAGTGAAGYSGDNGAATSAQMSGPLALCLDNAGNLYISDQGNYRIRKVDASNIITTIAGNGTQGYSGDGGPATAAKINNVDGVYMDVPGNLYIADAYNYRVRKVIFGNHPPYFTGGPVQNLSVCQNATLIPVNSLLAVIDTDAGQTETWSLTTPPAHGTVVASYSATSTGGMLTPTGLSYTPVGGYTGADVFNVTVSDGLSSAVTQINVTVNPLPDAGTISGIDSVCPAHTVTLSETVSGGIWSTSHNTISVANSSGIVTGIAPGYDTIIYTVVNACGVASAIFPFKVRSVSVCPAGVNTIPNTNNEGIKIFPNPAYNTLTISSIEKVTYVVINNLLEQKVYDHTFNAKEVQVNIADLPNGVYIIRINGSEVRKFLKE
ncbi:MAG: T9SS type A sorting domain-containing protein [Chitinophagales bacterium]